MTHTLSDITPARFLAIAAIELTMPAPEAMKNLISISQKILPSQAVYISNSDPPQIIALEKERKLKSVIQTIKHIAAVFLLRICQAKGMKATTVDKPLRPMKIFVVVIKKRGGKD